MGTVRYTNFGGQLVSESRNSVKRDYVPDPLGSTVALLDNSQTKTDTFAYWPFGTVRTRSGATDTPFQFIGTVGCRTETPGTSYVRARQMSSQYGRWQVVDPLSLGQGLYVYVDNSPTTLVDPAGLQANQPAPKPCASLLQFPVKSPNQSQAQACLNAYAKSKNSAQLAKCLGGPTLGAAQSSINAYMCCVNYNPNGIDCDLSHNIQDPPSECCRMNQCKCVLGSSKTALTKFVGKVYPGMDKVVWYDCMCDQGPDCDNALKAT